LFKFLLNISAQRPQPPGPARLQLSGHTQRQFVEPLSDFNNPLYLHKLETMWVNTPVRGPVIGVRKRFGAPSEITHLRLR
jgi:hypothetical protein